MTTTLHLQHTFFVYFFAVVLHDYNVKLPETSWLHFEWRKCRTCSRSLFFTAAHFHLAFDWWPLAFLFLSPPLQNFHVVVSCYTFQGRNIVCAPVPLFFTAAHFLSFFFLTAVIKFSCFSSNKNDLFCFLSLSLALRQ